jgi:hypothetical protein
MPTPSPQMLTANRLTDGDVLYWKAGNWVESLPEGEVFAEAAPAEAALAAAQATVGDNVVVNPYLFDVRVDTAGTHPVKEREIIRAAGPSVRDDLGKQAGRLTARAAAASARPAAAMSEKDTASEDGHVSI